MENEVRPILIELSNVKGLERAELRIGKPEPGKGQLITLVADNGQGKTSFLRGVSAIFTGGHDPSLIRDGQAKAEARMLLSDGTEIKRVVTRKGYRLDIKTADDTPVKAPESYVKRLASGFGFDPIQFITAKKDERLKYLLTVMPMEFTSVEIEKAAGPGIKLLAPPNGPEIGTQDITGLNRLVKDLTEKRGSIGSRRDEKAETVESLRKTLLTEDQADSPVDWKAKVAMLEGQRSQMERQERDDVALIEVQIRDVRADLEGRIRKAEDSAREEFTGLLERARGGDADMSIELNLGRLMLDALSDVGKWTAQLNAAAYDAQEVIDKTRADSSVAMQAVATELSAAQSGWAAQARTAGIKDEMEKFRAQAKALSADWDTVKAAITELETLRRSKLKELPVEGLGVAEDGTITVGGRDFDEINMGAQFTKSMEIGCVGAGDLGLVVVDNTVHLGPPAWKEFQEAVEWSGLTVIASRLATEEELQAHGPALRSEPAVALVTA